MTDVKRLKQTNDARMGLAEHLRVEWVDTAEEGTTVEDVLKPEYWAHVAGKLNPYDHIEVREETGKWVADLQVVWAERGSAFVFLKHKYIFPGASEGNLQESDFRVEWKGPHHKYAVIRVSTSEMLDKGFHTKDLALNAARGRERAMA